MSLLPVSIDIICFAFLMTENDAKNGSVSHKEFILSCNHETFDL